MNNKIENELILKRRKKKKIKRIILVTLLLVSILITLCLKLPFFNIKYIKVKGNNNITQSEIIKASKIYVNNNIFYININKSEKKIEENSYINDAKITRKLPNTIIINIVERNAKFYIDKEDGKYVLDNNAVLLEKRKSVETMKLVKIDGLELQNAKNGESLENIKDNKRKVDFLKQLSDLMDRAIKKLNITYVDINRIYDIRVYYNNMCIKLGKAQNLEKNMNKALNIIYEKKLENSKGYIDVSFKGNPALYIEK